MKTFRELKIWQQAHNLTLLVYEATTLLPSSELYGLVSQMRRAAVSIAANIVEGHKRHSQKEFLQFHGIADGSLEEVKYYIILSSDLRYLKPITVTQLQEQADLTGRLLGRFKQHLRNGGSHEQQQKTLIHT